MRTPSSSPARVASGTPPVVSWSVRAIAARPAACARRATSAGGYSPPWPLLCLGASREGNLGPQLPRIRGVGPEALQPFLELDLLGQPRRLGPVRHFGLAFGELREELRVLGVAEYPDPLAAGLGELTQFPQGGEVVGLVGRGHAHPRRREHLGHG